MRFKVGNTSGGGRGKARFKTLATLEDFLAFIDACDHDVIISAPAEEGNDWELEIYDDYRE